MGCGYAIGGVFGQAHGVTKGLMVLLYFSAHLSDNKQKWHPYRREFFALLSCCRESVKHFGRILKVFHTDHARIVRQVDLPVGRIDPMEYRWMVELQSGGSLLLYRPGTSQAPSGPGRAQPEPSGTQPGRNSAHR